MAPLSGHTAIVTGSGRNIGRAIVLALAAAGADVVVNGHRDRDRVDAVAAEVEALKTGAAAIGVMADVSDPDQVANLVKTSADAFGRPVGIAISNVGQRRRQPFEEITIDDWLQVM